MSDEVIQKNKDRVLSTVALVIVLISYVVLLPSVNRDETGTIAPIGFVLGFVGFVLSITSVFRNKANKGKIATITYIALMLSIIPLLGFMFMAWTLLRALTL